MKYIYSLEKNVVGDLIFCLFEFGFNLFL